MSDWHRFNALKILAHADRLRAIAAGKWPFPIDWHIYPTNRCNHHCQWCMFDQNGEHAEHPVKLSREQLLRAIDDAAEHDAKLVHFSGGGEPLLNHWTVLAMGQAQSMGLAVALTTNGRFLTPGTAAAVDYLRISLNAGTAEQHAKTSNCDDWDDIMDAVRASLPHRKRDASLAFVVDQHNWRDIVPFCRLAVSLAVDFVHIRPAFWYDAAKDRELRNRMPTILHECDRARWLFQDELPIHAITNRFDGYWSPRSYDCCDAVRTGICLTAAGDFAVCQDRMDLRFGAGYRDGQPFEEIWGGPEHQAVVATIVAGAELDRCPRCVWNKRNEIVDQVIRKDSMRLDMI